MQYLFLWIYSAIFAAKFGSSLKQITVAASPLYTSEQATDGTECICQTQCLRTEWETDTVMTGKHFTPARTLC